MSYQEIVSEIDHVGVIGHYMKNNIKKKQSQTT